MGRAAVVVAAIVLALAGAQVGKADVPRASCLAGDGEPVEVIAVNPYLDVELSDGRWLRISGMTPPRGTKKWPGLAAAAREALAGWIVGAPVLATIGSAEKDRWGRYAARIIMVTGGVSAAKGDIAGGLIEAGWALVDPAGAPSDCLPWLLALESKARDKRIGLWSDPDYRPVEATAVKVLAERAGSWILVEGKVVDVRPWRSVVFVNFARQRREGLSVMLTRRAVAAFQAAGIDPKAYAGRRLLVRGIPVLHNGPRITVSGPQFIEILTSPPIQSHKRK